MADAREPTIADIDALLAGATPHFAYQLRARLSDMIAGLPDDHPVRQYGAERVEMLDRLGRATSLANEGPLEPASRPGWDAIPSHGAVRSGADAPDKS